MGDRGSAATMCEAFQLTAARYSQEVALRTPGGAVSLTWGQYGQRVREIAAGLAGLGVGRGDTVGLMMANRPEFHLADTAAMHLGAAPFSVYNTLAAGQITHVVGNAGCRVVAPRWSRWCAWTASPPGRSPWRRWWPAVIRGSGSRTAGGRWPPVMC